MNATVAIVFTAWGFVTIASVLRFIVIFRPNPERVRLADGLTALGTWLVFVACVAASDLFHAVIFGSVAAFFTWKWWRDRRNGRMRKTLRQLGAKSRALIARLVDRMSPSPIPSPGGGS